jgi:hypothetical protein
MSEAKQIEGLKGSVGQGGNNKADDVLRVQKLLNKAGAGLKEDAEGRC